MLSIYPAKSISYSDITLKSNADKQNALNTSEETNHSRMNIEYHKKSLAKKIQTFKLSNHLE